MKVLTAKSNIEKDISNEDGDRLRAKCRSPGLLTLFYESNRCQTKYLGAFVLDKNGQRYYSHNVTIT